MALVKCPECGNENVSDADAYCMFCGFQLKEPTEENEEKSGEYCEEGIQQELNRENGPVDNGIDSHRTSKKKRITMFVILSVVAVLLLLVCVSCVPVMQKFLGIYNEKSIIGTWEVVEVIVDGEKTYSNPELRTVFTARFYSDKTGYMTTDGEKTEVDWAYEKDSEMGMWYRIYIGGACTYGMIATDPDEPYYGCFVHSIDRDLIMIYEKS